ncbi:MAG: shikimate dehydrogenase [Alphaproteobacteria bacterium]|nr:shikimate dehydrogenase [Alphaproteobacteria bacterium]
MIPTGRARVAGVMGWPVAHSRSPRLHRYWLDHYGIDGAYVPLAVPPERFGEALRALPALGFAGVNVTVPHKEAAVAAVDSVEPLARRIGAVNTVVVGRDGTLRGSNSDAPGFLAHLRAAVPDWQGADGPAVILGAGGAARAVIVALQDAGVREIRVVNRTRERAETLARDLGATIGDWAERAAALENATLLVNTTTLGMANGPPLDLALDRLGDRAIVYDLVYVPLETQLLAAARARGLRTVDGLGMLLYQARPGFAAWFGVDPAVTPELRAFVMATLQA